MAISIQERLGRAFDAADAAISSHDQQKVAAAQLQLSRVQLELEMIRHSNMPQDPPRPADPASTTRALIVQALIIIAGVTGVIYSATNLLDSRISDLGARVATVENRLVSIDAGIADLRVELASSRQPQPTTRQQ